MSNEIKRIDVVTEGWDTYHLIDTGEGRKLEQIGALVLDRPDPQALWSKAEKNKWVLANAHFTWSDKKELWSVNKGTPNDWQIDYQDTTFALSLGKFKHIGIFPEHESQWKEIRLVCQQKNGLQVLNLFGYTGAASIIAAKAGANVTHVDASKQTIAVVKQNINLSGLSEKAMRLLCEDALKYAKRLVQRGEQFEMIIMDPPAFGRGPKGEVWKIEEKLQELMSLVPKLLSKDARLVLLNGYAAGYSARTFGELLSDIMKGKGGEVTYGDMGIRQKNSSRVLSTGIYAKWSS